jgi:hypothetical protein
MNPSHTPTPWTLERYTDDKYRFRIEHDCVDHVEVGELSNIDEANAVYIVRAVNSYEAMTSALQRIKMNIDATPTTTQDITTFANLLGSIRSMTISALALDNTTDRKAVRK